jgi:hypothetical protein
MNIPALIGISLALIVAILARLSRFDRDRSFYPTVLVVIASYYDLFGAVGGSAHAILLETGVIAVALLVAYLGYVYSAWFVVVGLAAHGIFDLTHSHIIVNAGVPLWWPKFCLAYDVTAAAVLAWLLASGPRLNQCSKVTCALKT